jgi:ubiquinone/menaquinone biosynthesis C-methylase UbiE
MNSPLDKGGRLLDTEFPVVKMDAKLSAVTHEHLDRVRAFYEGTPSSLNRIARSYRRLLARYYDFIIPPDATTLEVGCGGGHLLAELHCRRVAGIDISPRQIEEARRRIPNGEFHVQSGEQLALPGEHFDYIIVSDTLNLVADVQQVFHRLQTVAHHRTRLVLNFHSALWRPILYAATRLGLKAMQPQSSWLATGDVLNLLNLAQWEVIKTQSRILLPFGGAFAGLINRYVAPLLPWGCLTVFCIARPRRSALEPAPRSVSVVIPARNESGNIQSAVDRMPAMGTSIELIFVEGHSRDNTWQEIQRVASYCPERKIKILQQTGTGKGNAVREGFAVATGDILMILDADLTMPPEELPKYYDVIASGTAEFANGVRLVYPMQERAMRFLNLCANKLFSIVFTWLLGQSVKDTLCGTKVMLRADYQMIAANRAYFGDFDPFGDFDLLFGADKLSLKIADVPIRYVDRAYGQTNIERWKHGLLLLRMVFFAAKKLKFV